ncbi:hypothetical protein PR003_g2142 [Phytophthora rubi]|uniref:Uncharacterized protein n=1 Tax=Phytophthora rubi TaxID=129364 RepID=A0A6A4G0X1_9STRA|nr:hypothetical protein PR003_g2142 [Phytophthora rubi]
MKAKEYEASTGAGITPDDEAEGVYSMPQKLEKMCSPYQLKIHPCQLAPVTPPLTSIASSAVVTTAQGASGCDAADEQTTTANDGLSARAQTPPKRKTHPTKPASSTGKRHATSASRTLELPTLNVSPSSASATASRNVIAGAMKMAAKTKAVVATQRLTFDRERWTSDAQRREAQQTIERERLVF